ncbi:NUDIX domain-containing protein [Candidatus Odyssella thessalonicensis]|uniref:NUDIX domain-containing protein n=1 Tax=Candidatus Odyssella thessalonicensis TaxID=84647 RepID=UPI000225B4B8|nr:NUDIX domain-containing protein [Candidatus Odyssella thessalonicensis]
MTLERFTIVPSVYLVLLKDNKTVLGVRKNTPWMNNHYGLISGHVEKGETPEVAIIREAYEEAGITVCADHLELSLIMYRQQGRTNIDFFFVSRQWQGEIENREPEKLGDWEWIDLKSPPANTIHYLTVALDHIAAGAPLQCLNYREGTTSL